MTTSSQIKVAQAERTYYRDLQEKKRIRGGHHRRAGRTVQVQALLRRLEKEGIR